LIWTAGARLLYECDFATDGSTSFFSKKFGLGDELFRQFCRAGDRNCPPEDGTIQSSLLRQPLS
ncbi:MAG: hypothetical protein ACLPHI_04420, partial [Terriglobales bacterium]